MSSQLDSKAPAGFRHRHLQSGGKKGRIRLNQQRDILVANHELVRKMTDILCRPSPYAQGQNKQEHFDRRAIEAHYHFQRTRAKELKDIEKANLRLAARLDSVVASSQISGRAQRVPSNTIKSRPSPVFHELKEAASVAGENEEDSAPYSPLSPPPYDQRFAPQPPTLPRTENEANKNATSPSLPAAKIYFRKLPKSSRKRSSKEVFSEIMSIPSACFDFRGKLKSARLLRTNVTILLHSSTQLVEVLITAAGRKSQTATFSFQQVFGNDFVDSQFAETHHHTQGGSATIWAPPRSFDYSKMVHKLWFCNDQLMLSGKIRHDVWDMAGLGESNFSLCRNDAIEKMHHVPKQLSAEDSLEPANKDQANESSLTFMLAGNTPIRKDIRQCQRRGSLAVQIDGLDRDDFEADMYKDEIGDLSDFDDQASYESDFDSVVSSCLADPDDEAKSANEDLNSLKYIQAQERQRTASACIIQSKFRQHVKTKAAQNDAARELERVRVLDRSASIVQQHFRRHLELKHEKACPQPEQDLDQDQDLADLADLEDRKETPNERISSFSRSETEASQLALETARSIIDSSIRNSLERENDKGGTSDPFVARENLEPRQMRTSSESDGHRVASQLVARILSGLVDSNCS